MGSYVGTIVRPVRDLERVTYSTIELAGGRKVDVTAFERCNEARQVLREAGVGMTVQIFGHVESTERRLGTGEQIIAAYVEIAGTPAANDGGVASPPELPDWFAPELETGSKKKKWSIHHDTIGVHTLMKIETYDDLARLGLEEVDAADCTCCGKCDRHLIIKFVERDHRWDTVYVSGDRIEYTTCCF